MAKLPEKSRKLFDYVKEHGGRVNIEDAAEALCVDVKTLNGTLTSMGTKGPHAKGLLDYEKVPVEGQDKPAKFVFLTEAGTTYEDTDEE